MENTLSDELKDLEYYSKLDNRWNHCRKDPGRYWITLSKDLDRLPLDEAVNCINDHDSSFFSDKYSVSDDFIRKLIKNGYDLDVFLKSYRNYPDDIKDMLIKISPMYQEYFIESPLSEEFGRLLQSGDIHKSAELLCRVYDWKSRDVLSPRFINKIPHDIDLVISLTDEINSNSAFYMNYLSPETICTRLNWLTESDMNRLLKMDSTYLRFLQGASQDYILEALEENPYLGVFLINETREMQEIVISKCEDYDERILYPHSDFIDRFEPISEPTKKGYGVHSYDGASIPNPVL